jgi:uncharacterized protein YybS (DUF2232 family)
MQTEPVKTVPASPLVSVGKAIAVTTVMGMILAVVPLLPAVVIPFLALPVAWVVASRGLRYGVLALVLSAVLIYVGGGTPTALLVLFFVLGIGLVLGLALARRWRFESTLTLASLGALAAMVLWGVALWQVFGVDVTWLRETAYTAIDNAAARYTQMGIAAGSAEAVAEQLRRLVNIIPLITPGLLGMAAILLAACTMGLAFLILPRLRERIVVALSLSGFRMHWGAAYASIAGLAMLLFARGDSSWSTVVMYVGINVLLVSQTLFFLQGLAVTRWFAVTRNMSGGAWTALCTAGILAQMLFQITGLVGLFDTWVDFRRRFVPKGPDEVGPRGGGRSRG